MNIFGVVGWKNTGKTGLVTRLVAHFSAQGLRVSTVKHAHHSFDVDHEGRDSYRHRQAGAEQVLIASRERTALIHELRGAPEPDLNSLLAKLDPVDVVIIEGYKGEGHPKIETHRAEANKDLIAPGDGSIRAVASDVPLPDVTVPVFDLDDTVAIAAFILRDMAEVA